MYPYGIVGRETGVNWPTGDVEILTNISPGENLQLEAHHFSIGITFLELVHLPGETTATIKTTKPLDADALSEVSSHTPLISVVYTV